MINWKCFITVLLLVVLDFAIYIFFGLVILNYEDFYNESKGEYWSLMSMTTVEKIAYVGYFVWCIVNILLILWFTYKLIKVLRRKLS